MIRGQHGWTRGRRQQRGDVIVDLIDWETQQGNIARTLKPMVHEAKMFKTNDQLVERKSTAKIESHSLSGRHDPLWTLGQSLFVRGARAATSAIHILHFKKCGII